MQKTAEARTWRTYEQVAQDLLQQFAADFGLRGVEGKQTVHGASGTDWEIDAKGIREIDGATIVVECRRRTTSKLSQGQIGEIAFRIIDIGAQGGGLVVSPLGLQRGAKLLAASKNIHHVVLDPASTTAEYLMEFLKNVFAGSEIKPSGNLDADLIKDGKIAESRDCG
jgi:hypothetical protein